MSERFVYADNAATTQMSEGAWEAMLPYLRDSYGNPSSIYKLAQTAKRALDTAREQVAAALNAKPEEIYFTSGGTEADNTAVSGALRASKRGGHVVTSAIEHHAMLHSIAAWTGTGTQATILGVDRLGRVDVNAVRDALRDDTALCSVMAGNNEIGTVQDVKAMGAACRERGVWFHTDAVQMAGHLPIDVADMNLDMLSLSAHKFHGPKGVGALFVRKGVNLPPLLYGGGHERRKRAGTENVAGIVGMGYALTEAVRNLEADAARTAARRDALIAGILNIPYSRLTGDPKNRLPGIASFVFEACEGETLVLKLDYNGVCASSGSACSSASLDPSHVLLAAGLPQELAHGSLRLSLSHNTSDEDVAYLIRVVTEAVASTRSLSPLWDGGKPTVQF